jgi:hypothetical protein
MSGTIAEDVPPARSRSGGFLSEGSPQGRMGKGPYTAILLLNTRSLWSFLFLTGSV